MSVTHYLQNELVQAKAFGLVFGSVFGSVFSDLQAIITRKMLQLQIFFVHFTNAMLLCLSRIPMTRLKMAKMGTEIMTKTMKMSTVLTKGEGLKKVNLSTVD